MESLPIYRKKFNKLVHKDTQLSYSEITYIDFIYLHNGQLTHSQLANLLEVSKPAVTQSINKLVAKGYIKKTPSPEDGRIILLNLTDRYHALDQQVNEDLLGGFYDSLTSDEIALLSKILIKYRKKSVLRNERSSYDQ